ncbi:MAG: hypothetical protein MJ189_05685, partial [Coriobacteriales bacterium]|nr:hypothetical protein [Coriobacteriales bacterium]
MDLLKTLDQNTLNDSRFLLLYIDDDEIPEIYITGPKGAAPSYTMLTYCNGKVTGEDTSPNFANYNSI